ncbi:paraquat-inducible protein A [soil metagenome]
MAAALENIWIKCPDCEAPCRDRALPRRGELKCVRCGAVLKKRRMGDTMQLAWALATAALPLLVLANVESIMTFNIAGNRQSNLIITGVFGLVDQGYWPVSVLVFFSAIAAPTIHLVTVWYVVGACCLRQKWPGVKRALRLAEHLEAWNLVPVYAVGTMVAAVKLDMLGQVEWDQGAFWVVILSVCTLFIVQVFDREAAETRLKELG